jgi:hypothetical protein
VAGLHKEGKLSMGPRELRTKLEQQLETKSPDVHVDWKAWDPIRRRSTRTGAIDEHTFGMLRGLEEKRFAATKEA